MAKRKTAARKTARHSKKAAPATRRAAGAKSAKKTSAKKALKTAAKSKNVKRTKKSAASTRKRTAAPARAARPVKKAAPKKIAAKKASVAKKATKKLVKKAASKQAKAPATPKTLTPIKAVKKTAAAPAPAPAAPKKAAAPKAAAKPTTKAKSKPKDRALIGVDRPAIPSSLTFDRPASQARSGREELLDHLEEHTETGPAITGGDIDANWEVAYSSGDEAPGGDNPTPDQDVVDEIGEALGVQYQDDEELKGAEKIADRDRHRWELDPASAEDYPDHKG